MLIVLPTHPVRATALAVLAPVAIILAGCSAQAAPPPGDQTVAAAAPADRALGESTGGAENGHSGHGNGGVGLYAVQSGPLGVVVTEGDGRLVYMNTADTPTSSACTDACAQEWLPLIRVEGVEPELLGVDEELVGELSRPEGVQLTIAGHPLYHRIDDTGTLTDADAAPHGRDGVWFVIAPDGEQVPLP